jgi:hypothetical protein
MQQNEQHIMWYKFVENTQFVAIYAARLRFCLETCLALLAKAPFLGGIQDSSTEKKCLLGLENELVNDNSMASSAFSGDPGRVTNHTTRTVSEYDGIKMENKGPHKWKSKNRQSRARCSI